MASMMVNVSFLKGKAWWFVEYLSLVQGLATILLWGMAPRTSAGPQPDLSKTRSWKDPKNPGLLETGVSPAPGAHQSPCHQ